MPTRPYPILTVNEKAARSLRAGSVSDQEAAQLEELLEEYKNR